MMTARIKKVEVYGVEVPLVGAGFKNAYITKTKQRSAVVRITDEHGQIGLGNIDHLLAIQSRRLNSLWKLLRMSWHLPHWAKTPRISIF